MWHNKNNESKPKTAGHVENSENKGRYEHGSKVCLRHFLRCINCTT